MIALFFVVQFLVYVLYTNIILCKKYIKIVQKIVIITENYRNIYFPRNMVIQMFLDELINLIGKKDIFEIGI